MFVINSDGSDEHLIDSGAFVGGASWSPDGRRLAWLHADANVEESHTSTSPTPTDETSSAFYPHVGIPRHALDYDVYSQAIGWSADGKQVVRRHDLG